MALIDAAEAISHLAQPRLDIEPARCVRVRNRNARCEACMAVCPTGAVSVHDNAIEFDDAACLGCGACATACPTQALATAVPTAQTLMDHIEQACAHAGASTLALVCHRAVPAIAERLSDTRTIALPCLAFLDEAHLVHAWTCGARTVLPVSQGCNDCPNRQHDLIAAVAHQARRYQTRWELPGRVSVLEADGADDGQWKAALALEDPAGAAKDGSAEGAPAPGLHDALTSAGLGMADPVAVSRRGLLTTFFDRTVDSVAFAAVETFHAGHAGTQEKATLAQVLRAQSGSTLKKFSSQRADALLNDLFELPLAPNVDADGSVDGEGDAATASPGTASEPDAPDARPEAADAHLLHQRIFATPRINASTCTRCGACVTFCPTGALSGTASPHTAQVKTMGMLRSMGGAMAGTGAAGEDAGAGADKGTVLFRPSDCVGCGLCEDVCPTRALSLAHATDPRTLFELEPARLV